MRGMVLVFRRTVLVLRRLGFGLRMRMLLLLLLLELPHLLVMLLFHLLELLLLLLLHLALPLLVGVLLLQFLLLLILLLLDLLVFLILLLLQLLNLVLVLLLELRIHGLGRTRTGRPVVMGILIHACIGVHVGRPVVVYRLAHIRLRIYVLAHRAIRVGLHPEVAMRGIRHHLCRRRYTHCGDVCTRLLDGELPSLRHGNWAALVGLDGFLALRKRGRWRRRCRLGHHCPRLERRRGLETCRCARAQNRLLRRNCRRGADCNRCRGDFPLIHTHHVAADGLSRGERLRGSRGHRAIHILVHVMDVAYGNVFIDHGGVVVVVNHRLAYGSVGNVHIVDVGAADGIGGHEDFARPQGEPADIHANAYSGTEANAHSEVRSADPCNKGGRIYGPNVTDRDNRWRARHPAPGSTVGYPATIVERSEAPRGIVNPGPAPRGDPNPVAEAVGGPSNHGDMGEPHRAVFRHRPPATVIIEVLVTDDVFGDVA